jgi:hypothetical protein
MPIEAPTHSNSPDLMKLAQLWFEVCKTTHTRCQENTGPASYPTRLIEIASKTLDPRLILTNQHQVAGEYATLSHCWGGQSVLRLLQENHTLFKERIPFSILPKTFQDAVNVCKTFGLRCIWIDSLCIVRKPLSLHTFSKY